MEKRIKDDFVLEQEEQMETPSSSVVTEEVSWLWKREALQRCKAGINLYVRFNIIDDIKRELQIIGAGVYQEFVNSCFGCFFKFHWDGYNNAALHALIAQEITKVDAPKDELWFRVGEQCIRFSKYEYALVTGLRFGGSTFDPNAPHDPPKTGVYSRLLQHEGRLVLDDLRDRFTRGEFRQLAADALKVAKVLFVYYMLFGLDGRQTSVDRWVWALIEDSERWESFPWGKYSFQILLHYIQGLPVRLRLPQPGRRRPPSYHFYGCSFALLIWACEAIPLLGSTCGSRVSTDQLPRCLRWRFRKMSVDMTDFFFNKMVCSATLQPSIEEQQQLYWQHIDEDICSGIQYVHRETRFRRPMSSVAITASQAQSSRSAATTTAAASAQSPRTAAVISPTPISFRRPQKQQRIDLSSCDAVIREEVGLLERRIPKIIREELRLLFPYMRMSREEQAQEEDDQDNFFDVPMDPLMTVADCVPMSVTHAADTAATSAPPPDPGVTCSADTTTPRTPPLDLAVTSSGADMSTISTSPLDTSMPPIIGPLVHRLPEMDAPKAYGEELVGCKVKVWRPKSKTFSEGGVASYNHSHKKHFVVCANGIEEMLNLRKHIEPAEDVSANQAKKEHSRSRDLSYMYDDDYMDAHVHLGKKHKGQPFDLKSHSTSPTLSKDQKMEAGVDSRLGDDGVHDVNGYKVKSSAAPILEAILDKHGDIAAHCIYKSPSVRASLLEVVCNVVQRLQYDDFEAILSQLEVMENELSDVEASKIQVSWLLEHLAKLGKIGPFREKSIELRKSKAKSDIVAKAADDELKERHGELVVAQERFKEAEKRVNALRLVCQKIDGDIVESESEEYFWRRRLDDLV